ncbi:MAG: hypothetical protein GY859_20415 [Desulfobacterales bacterium]|nr:hypothetical protein [Desulfobacterales bacterium]
MRQVIINTHSTAVVAEAPDDSLLIAESVETYADGERGANVRFSCLPETWRGNAPEKPHVVAKGDLLAYLNPRFASSPLDPETRPIQAGKRRRALKVRDREDLQRLLPSEVM